MDLFRIFNPAAASQGDEPRKKGWKRYWELVFRDGRNGLLAGAAACLFLLPGALFCAVTTAAEQSALALISGLLGGVLAGPSLAGVYDTLLRMLRDRPELWAPTWKRSLRVNLRASLLPGALNGLFFAAAVYLLRSGSVSRGAPLPFLLTVLIAGTFLQGLLTPLWAQTVLMELPFFTRLRNSLLLLFSHPGRFLLAGLIETLAFMAWVIFAPGSLILALFPGFWMVVLAGLVPVYETINDTFSIEETLSRRTGQGEAD